MGIHVLQKAAMMLTQKKGTQQVRNVPTMMPTVVAALDSDTWQGAATFFGRDVSPSSEPNVTGRTSACVYVPKCTTSVD